MYCIKIKFGSVALFVENCGEKNNFRFSDDLKRPQRRSARFEFFLEPTAEQAQSFPSVVQTVRGKRIWRNSFFIWNFYDRVFVLLPPMCFAILPLLCLGIRRLCRVYFGAFFAVFRLSRVAYGNDSVGANIGTSRRRFRGKTINKNTVKTMDLF